MNIDESPFDSGDTFQGLPVPAKPMSVTEEAAHALNREEAEAEIKKLVGESRDIVAVIDTASRGVCHDSMMVLKNMRITVEKRAKAGRDRAVQYSKAVIQIEKELIAMVEPEEKRLAALRDAFDTIKERERQAKVEAELKRQADIQARIAELRGCQTLSPTNGSVLIAEHIADLEAIPVDESFDEFRQSADDAKTAALARLRALHAAAVAHEAEQARIIAERAELAALRAAQEERDRQARAEQARKDADAQVERDRLAAIAQAERLENERIARESLRLERERIAAEEVEAIRLRGIEQAKQVEAARAHAQELRQAREALEAEVAANRARESERAAAIEAAAEIERKKNAEEAAALVAQRAQFEAEQAEIARQQAEANKPKPSKAQSKVPSKLCADLESHLYAIDAYVFSSDTFETDKARARLRYFMGRWERDFAAKEKVA